MAVEGHPRSSILARTESNYATSLLCRWCTVKM